MLALLVFVGARAYYAPQLPSVADLHEIKLGVPLRVYTHDGKLIGEFGAERREPLRYEQLPQPLVQAFLAAEDDRFFSHSGVDFAGLLRATVVLATTGEKRQGGSTITMQLARNVFLTNERSFSRKFKEIFLARKIESELTKQQILELYLNRIFLGNRAYGVGAAAQVYFGKDVSQLTIGEMATIAGLPKAPSRDNPLSNPKRARERRDYVLRRMHDLGFIAAEPYKLALAEPVTAYEHPAAVEVEGRYVAEMVRAELYAKYGEKTYSDGYTVVTTLDAARQQAATAALRGGLLAYEERHGYSGAEAKLPAELLATLAKAPGSPEIRVQLDARPPVVGLEPAIVLAFTPDLLTVHTAAGRVELPKTAFAWAGLSDKKPLRTGDMVRIAKVGSAWRLTQIPDVQGAFIALNPRDGAMQALVGGYDFFLGNFNRVTQARRQVGSGFKPFLYTAALSKGYTPASVFLDAPVVFTSINPDDDWRPGNYEGKFKGPMRLRDALALSRNLVSVRVAQAVGLNYAREFASHFGIPKDRIPDDLTMALGSAALTPMEQARAYCVFANGGFLVNPYFIESIKDAAGNEIFRARPKIACPECDAEPAAAQTITADVDADEPEAVKVALAAEAKKRAEAAAAAPAPLVAAEDRAPRVLDADLDFLITSMMHDVVTRGTAAQVKALGRDDLAGKTGTSNDETDAWFNGFSPALVAVTWVGFDQPRPLGKGEVGGRSAVPIWMDFMKTALKGIPSQRLPMPAGISSVAINPSNGKLVSPGAPGALFEIVQSNHIPPPDDGRSAFGDTEPSGTDIY
ncbi:MAG: penicillin-binding protein 1A [Nevskia sp.]